MEKLPETVREGMDVYDRDDERIGTVESLRFGDEAAAEGISPAGMRGNSFIDNLAEAIWPDDMSEQERKILLSEGYLRLDAAGLLEKDRYIRPSQIDAVTADGVRLNVSRDQLMTT